MKTLKDHMYGIKLDNQLLNYNIDALRGLENQFNSLESVEQNSSTNDLFIFSFFF